MGYRVRSLGVELNIIWSVLLSPTRLYLRTVPGVLRYRGIGKAVGSRSWKTTPPCSLPPSSVHYAPGLLRDARSRRIAKSTVVYQIFGNQVI